MQLHMGVSRLTCCDLVPPRKRDGVASWVDAVLTDCSLDVQSYVCFRNDIHAVWDCSETQFLSLGYSPSFAHATVYVKPSC